MTDMSRPHDGPTLKVRLVFDEAYMGLGRDCCQLAQAMVDAYNATTIETLSVLDAKWATPEPEWEQRGRGWA